MGLFVSILHTLTFILFHYIQHIYWAYMSCHFANNPVKKKKISENQTLSDVWVSSQVSQVFQEMATFRAVLVA